MKRILVNIIIAFTVFPIYFLAKDFITLSILKDHSAYSGTFSEYVALTSPSRFFTTPLLFLILLLLPYNVILMFFYRRGKTLTLIRKYLLFLTLGFLIVFLWYPTFDAMLLYIVTFSILALLCVTPLHYLVDKKEFRQNSIKT